MKFLLDSHALLWWDQQPEQLSDSVRAVLRDRNNTVLVSVASLWELQIKQQLGKLDTGIPLQELVRSQQETNGILVLAITFSHVVDLDNLPLHHRDPFDRMLIAQARVEGATLVSKDAIFGQYDVPLLW